MQQRDIPIEALKEAEYNPRQATEKQVKDLTESIKKFGIVDPVIVNSDMTIIGGHFRVRVAKSLGINTLPCVVLDIPKDQEKELNLRLNKNVGAWDWELLANMETELLIDVGFDAEELSKQFDLLIEPDAKDDEVPDVPDEPQAKLGDIYKLGNHRIMCGDATKIEDVERLMDGKKADIGFTSPPYNAGKNIRGNFYENDSDNKSEDEYTSFLVETTLNSLEYCKYSFVNLGILESNKHSIIDFQTSMRDYVKDILVWNKSIAPPHINKGTFATKWEYLFAFSKDSKSRSFPCKWQGLYTNVIETENNSSNEFAEKHKAGFPIAFPLWIITKMDFAKIILDIFIGTGSTLIACEKTNRICYGMEIDPKYIDVIIKRWEEYTGNKAELIKQ